MFMRHFKIQFCAKKNVAFGMEYIITSRNLQNLKNYLEKAPK